ncbi:MAG TPA: sulfite exporter TauE/SafE family protein [Planctomycetaceae bacterium]|nr:sulfite exporter TauE/SafE family protein [Planctomycetaceae bacterium]
MWFLSLLYGMIVGFSLGLTGGGGSIFAVPLLVYGIGVPPREAVGISLAAVGTTTLVGCVQRVWRHEVEVGTGLLFAIAGMAGAPVGSWLGGHIPGTALLLMFSVLMALVATRMWINSIRKPAEASVVRAEPEPFADDQGPTCRRDPEGKLRLTSRCALLLGVIGLLTGVLSGLFGVGGGFVIVPALVLFSGMGIHRAVATSLLVITLVSASGVVSYIAAGRPLDWELTWQFVGGGVAGLALGTVLARALSGPRLQQVFAAAIIVVAIFIVVKSLTGAY